MITPSDERKIAGFVIAYCRLDERDLPPVTELLKQSSSAGPSDLISRLLLARRGVDVGQWRPNKASEA